MKSPDLLTVGEARRIVAPLYDALNEPATSYDNSLRDVGTQCVKGYTAPTFADLYENAPFAE